MNKILKWSLIGLGGLALLVVVSVITANVVSEDTPEVAQTTVAPATPAPPAPGITAEQLQNALDSLKTNLGTQFEEREKEVLLQNKRLEEALAKAQEALLAKATAPAPATTVTTPVAPVSNHEYLSGVTPQNLTLGEWQEKITEKAENFVDIHGDAEFRKVFKQFSPPETKDGQVRSYVLVQLPGESRMRFWDSKQQPPIALPAGFSRFARDEVGSWMVVK